MNDRNFSIEYIFAIVEMHHHAVGIHFIPTSVSCRIYPKGIVLHQIVSKQKETLVKNVLNCINTFGTITGEGYDNQKPFESCQLEVLTFTTFDILKLESSSV